MNLSWIDWSIMGLFALGLLCLALYTKKYTKSVADFLVANRCAGRYLLSISSDISGMGAISCVALFEMYYRAGFCALWWAMLSFPVSLLVILSGFVTYRYRETRVMTMAQLFEVRYSRNFRVYSGIIAWATGVINMGIFPAVTAHFFIYFCGLPESFECMGVPVSTFVFIMILELSIALLFTFMGGMIVVIITDFMQGMFCNIAFLVILIALFFYFDWDQIISALKTAPENASMLNPFHTTQAEGFSIYYFLIITVIGLYKIGSWQGKQGYSAAARNAHEAKMAGVIGTWKELIKVVLLAMIPICAYTLLHLDAFAHQSNIVETAVSSISSETIQKQMTVPLALIQILPIGLIGLFGAVMLAAAISTDDTYMHSWGCIFIQDVILPFKKKGLSTRSHFWLLRLSILLVAILIFLFSLFFKQSDFILMYMALTGSIYIGGAGAVIIGGLYWKRGTTVGAWVAMLIGGIVSAGGLLIMQLWPQAVPLLMDIFPGWQYLRGHQDIFPFDGVQISIFAIILAVAGYLLAGLWSWLVLNRPAFNMDKMLHRGNYALKGEHEKEVILPPTGIRALLPTKEFSRGDRILYYCISVWNIVWFLLFITVPAYHFIWGTDDNWWARFWYIYIWISVALGIGTSIWFLLGGWYDFKIMLKMLKVAVRNKFDDGRVMDHQNLEDSQGPNI